MNWDKCYMDMAERLSQESKDHKVKVGCIIVSLDKKQIISCGVNGGPIGGYNKRISNKKGQSGFICAELNALIRCGVPTWVGKILYCNLQPCDACARAIINAGVSKVFYRKSYKSSSSKLLLDAGIELIQV